MQGLLSLPIAVVFPHFQGSPSGLSWHWVYRATLLLGLQELLENHPTLQKDWSSEIGFALNYCITRDGSWPPPFQNWRLRESKAGKKTSAGLAVEKPEMAASHLDPPVSSSCSLPRAQLKTAHQCWLDRILRSKSKRQYCLMTAYV